MSGADTVELKPCPFCGDVAKVAHIVLPNGGWWAVECASNDCGCIGPSRQTEAEAITTWNTRATQADALAVMREAAEVIGAMLEAIDHHNTIGADPLVGSPFRDASPTLANLRAAIARMGGCVMEFWNETAPVAKKPHKCDACRQPIEVGTRYARMAGKFDGVFFTVIQHEECRAAEIAIAREKGLFGGEDWVHLNDLDEPDDLLWLEQEHPVVFSRIKEQYSAWLED